ncbi:DUF2199 domain-containing protein [Actinoplanes sp. NPDC051494]|uniref:DUF2199 domain-containing protein n=1 Tax=Actinoplanes sp. NPDC051494 TaxID=3363907 RepID=UPI00378BADBD
MSDPGQHYPGLPFSYGATAPVYWSDEFAGDERSALEQEVCVIRAEHFFVRARLILPVIDAETDFEWGVWVSLSAPSFSRMMELWSVPGREREPSSFGWLCTELPGYRVPTVNLKTHVHTGPVGERPHIELEPTDHPLALEQRMGITTARVREIAELIRRHPGG